MKRGETNDEMAPEVDGGGEGILTIGQGADY